MIITQVIYKLLIKLAKSNKYDEIDTYKENLKDLINLQKKGNA